MGTLAEGSPQKRREGDQTAVDMAVLDVLERRTRQRSL